MQRVSSRAARLRAHVEWTIKERRGGLWVPVWRNHNLMTDFGLTALAGAFGGSYDPPIYLVIDQFAGLITDVSGTLVGATTIHLDRRIDEAGDTKLTLGVGTANQEEVTFSSVTGSGPYAYTISAATHTHANGDKCARSTKQSDTVSDIQGEVEYSPVAAPGKRLVRTGSGFSGGTGNQVMSFFLSGSQATGVLVRLGTSESDTVGADNLHNVLISGYNHAAGVDAQIDLSLTLANA